jgi:hypothetical protein
MHAKYPFKEPYGPNQGCFLLTKVTMLYIEFLNRNFHHSKLKSNAAES